MPIYVDRNLEITEITLPGGKQARGFLLGVRSPDDGYLSGRRFYITVPDDIGSQLSAGLHEGVVVVLEKKIFSVIKNERPNKLIMFLSPRPGDESRLGDGILGTIRVLRGQKKRQMRHPLVRMESGRKREEWRELMLWAQPGDAFLLNWSNSHASLVRRIVYVIDFDQVIDCELNDLPEACKEHHIAMSELPFTAMYDIACAEMKIKRSEWTKLTKRSPSSVR